MENLSTRWRNRWGKFWGWAFSGPGASRSPVDEARLLTGIDVIASARREDDAQVVRRLRDAGYSESEAELLICFAPLALGRLLAEYLPPATVPKLVDYIEIHVGQSRPPLRLALKSVVLFADLQAVARSALVEQRMTKDSLMGVALRGSEMKLVNQLMLEKRDVAKFVFTAALAMRIKPEWIEVFED